MLHDTRNHKEKCLVLKVEKSVAKYINKKVASIISVFVISHFYDYINSTSLQDHGQGTKTTTSGPTFPLDQIAKKMANVTNKTSVNIVSNGPHFTETLKESNVIKGGLNENPGFGNGLKGMDPSQIQVEPTMVSGSIPVWTDEQLNELFDDFADDM